MTTDTKRTFEATIWEKAEHWTFEVTIRAENEKEAMAQLLRDFPRRDYTIRGIYA
jgi:hypothetical protein